MSKVSVIKLLRGLYAAKIPTNMIGGFGAGKSSRIYLLGQQLGVHVVLKTLSKMDPTDFSGLPYLSESLCLEYDRNGNIVKDENGNPKNIRAVKTSPSPFIKELLENPNGILFMDEINRGAPTLQNAALTLIQDGDAGDVKIPSTIWRVSAMNMSDVGCNTFSLAAANRFCHIECEADIDEFTDGFISGFQEIEEPIINKEEDVIKNNVKYRTFVVKFLKDNPVLPNKSPKEGGVTDKSMLSNIPDGIFDIGDLSFPTPRTWELAVKALSYLDKNDKDYVYTIVKGCVGKIAAREFLNYLSSNETDYIDLTEFVGKEDTFVIDKEIINNRPDVITYILQNIEYLLDKDTNKYFNLWKRIIRILHNKNGKYGKYGNFDYLISKYFVKDYTKIGLNMIEGNSEKEYQKNLERFHSDIDDANEVLMI